MLRAPLTFDVPSENCTVIAREPSPAFQAAQLSRLIFVGGSPRSGTTLVQRILDCHPRIYGGPEFDFVPRIVELFQGIRESIRSGRIDAILDDSNLVHAFRSLVAGLLLPKLEAEGVDYLSEKTPSNVLAFAWLEACIPEAKKILVLRDPRDIVSSMLEVGKRQRSRLGRTSGFIRDTVAAVAYMNQCLAAGLQLVENSNDCLVVYYEDVVADPLGIGNKIYRFIGVDEMETLNLESEEFEAPRNRDSWIDWATPGTVSGGVEKGRVGIAEQRLRKSDWDYVCSRTIQHPLITKRYSLPPPRRTIAGAWCVARSLATRVRDGVPGLWAAICRQLVE
jgi:Sulfotransferase family